MLRTALSLAWIVAAVTALGAPPDAGTALARRVDRIINSNESLSRAHIGVRVVDLSGRVIYQRNARGWFVPASNTKLFSTALALTRLGPIYRTMTQITAESAVDPTGTVLGDLRFLGGGDPSLSGRTYPYRKDADWADTPQGLDDLADQLVRGGIRQIRGGVVGDDTAYEWEPFPQGWGLDDPLFEYGAPVSALTLMDNAMRVEVRPGPAPGVPARITLYPDLGQVILIPQVYTLVAGEKGAVHFDRPANTGELRVYGSIAADAQPLSTLLAVDDPALYAARALTDALISRGVEVRDPPSARHRREGEALGPDWPAVLAAWQSPPVSELVRVVNKVSQNLHAELLLCEVSRRGQSFGSRAAGLEELRAFLRSDLKLAPDDAHFEDGSGLSRLTLLTPEAITRLLVFMASSPARDAWFASLPVGGEDGTLSRRFRGSSGNGPILAKTGSLTHVNALSGYLEHPAAGTLAFSILVNNANATATEVRAGIDKLVKTLLEY